MKKTLFLLLMFPSIILIAQPPGYSFGKYISINNTEVTGVTNFTDFTILISVIDPDLRSVANGGHVESSNGYDIIFTLGDCATLLSHQIEKYDATTGEYISWVKLPLLNATENTNFHMYYGNSSIAIDPSTVTTWNNDFEGVWHMNNDPSTTTLTDYSGNGMTGESHGTMTFTDLVSGKIGSAIDFDGSNDYFSLATKFYNASEAITELTVSAWIKTSYVGGTFNNWSIIDFDRSEYFNVFVHGDGRLGFATRGAGISDSYAGTAGDLNDDNWHYVTAVYDGTNKLLYIDGALILTVADAHSGAGLGTGVTRFAFIGDGSEATTYNGGRNNIYYDGQYDEIHFSNTPLSGNWINTEYNNQNTPASFHTIGSELDADELCTLLPISLYSFFAEQQENKVQLKWTTLSELNNDYFTIEHSTGDFSDWQEIATIDAAGTSSELLTYTTTHENPFYGINYYRLKQTDYDGTFKYFEIRSINYLNNDLITYYPNPTSNELFISSNQSLANSTILIYDQVGRNVTQMVEIKLLSENKVVLNLEILTNGVYTIHTPKEKFQVVKN